MGRRLRLGRIFGVEVSLDWSWILAFVFAAWTLVTLGARAIPGLAPVPLFAAGVASAAGLFASLALHEIAHGIAARACGVPVRHVTLFLVGGISDVERDPASPRTEVIGALAAPAASIGVALALTLAVVVVGGPLPRGLDDLDRLGTPGLVLCWLALANFAVAAVNLLPAFPLDGGRLVRAAIWQRTGDVQRATRWAAWIGQLLGWSLIVLGVVVAVMTRGTAIAGAMWLALLGWFVASAAAQGYEGVVLQDVLAGVSVERLMRRSFVAVPADLTVATAMRTFLARADGGALPVVDGHELVGMLSLRDVRALPTSAWRNTLAREAARGTPAKTVAPRDLVTHVLATTFASSQADRIPVVEGGRLVGILDRGDVTRWIEAQTTASAVRRSEAF